MASIVERSCEIMSDCRHTSVIFMSETPCWKNTIKSSRSLRWQMSWQSPCRQSGKSCHQNTSSTRLWWTSPSAWLSVWLPVVVILSICLSVSVAVSMFKSVSLSQHQQTDSSQRLISQARQNTEKWGLSWLKLNNFVSSRRMFTKLDNHVQI